MREHRKERVALIGHGYWGRRLLAALARSRTCEVAYVCSPSQRRDRTAARTGPATVFTPDLDRVHGDPTVRGVIIATPIATHYEITRQALRAGKHVLVEKPLCLRAREASILRQAARRRGLVLQTEYTYLFSPNLAKMKQLMDRGWIGRPTHVQMRVHQLGRFRRDDVYPLLIVHLLAVFRFLMPGRRVRCRSVPVVTHRGRVTTALVQLDAPCGTPLGTLGASLDDPIRDKRVVLFGERGSVAWSPSERPAMVAVRYDRTPSPSGRPYMVRRATYDLPEDDNLGRALDAFARAMRRTEPDNAVLSSWVTRRLEELRASTGGERAGG